MNNSTLTKRDYALAFFSILLSVIFWGVSFISTKVILNELPPVSIAFFRQLVGLIPLVVWLYIKKGFIRISIRHVFLFTVSGFFGIVLYFVFENSGLQYTTASSASMIVAALPIFMLVTESFLYKKKISLRSILFIALSMFGVYLVITVNGRLNINSSDFLGNMLVVGAMICWVVYTIVSRKLSMQYSSILITTYQMFISTFLFVPFILPEIHRWKSISLLSLGNLLYLGLFCSAFAYFFFVSANKRLGPTLSAAFLNLIPVVTVIAAFFFLHEKITPVQIMGMLLIMFSLYRLNHT